MDELMKIPGLGRDRAEKIINYRDENGDFEDWDDVKSIPGFSDELIDTLKKSGAAVGEEGEEETEEEWEEEEEEEA